MATPQAIQKCEAEIQDLRTSIQKFQDFSANPSPMADEAKKLGMAPFKHKFAVRAKLPAKLKIACTAWTSDSTHVLSGSQEGFIIHWNARLHSKDYYINTKTWLFSCAYSPDNTMIAAGGLDNNCSIYKLPADGLADKDFKSKAAAAVLAKHAAVMNCCKFVDNSKVLTASGDSTLLLWDIESRNVINKFMGHTDDVTSFDWMDKDKNTFVTGSGDGTSKIFDRRIKGTKFSMEFSAHLKTWQDKPVAPADDPDDEPEEKVDDKGISSVCALPTGNAFISGSDDSSCCLFDVRAGRMLNMYVDDNYASPVLSMDVSKGGRMLVAAYKAGRIMAWDVATGAQIQDLAPGTSDITRSVRFSPDGQALATGDSSKQLTIWA